jgi:hypothetical protein
MGAAKAARRNFPGSPWEQRICRAEPEPAGARQEAVAASDAREHRRVGSSSSRWSVAAASLVNLDYRPLAVHTYRYV